MSAARRIALRIDDPLSPATADTSGSPPRAGGDRFEAPPPNQPATDHRPAGRPRRRRRADAAEPTGRTADGPLEPGAWSRPWRAWSGSTRVASYRLPDELLAELGEVANGLRLPIGLIVTAAITRVLDEPATVIAELVDRADDARIHGRRLSRRGRGQQRDEDSTGVEGPSTC
ncbi:MAG: hypothetical protein ACRDMJ_14840 [Solirubrobacteraceae bacterium]